MGLDGRVLAVDAGFWLWRVPLEAGLDACTAIAAIGLFLLLDLLDAILYNRTQPLVKLTHCLYYIGIYFAWCSIYAL